MDAIILAAGFGSRLQPITNHTPKPGVSVNGTPILEHQINAYDSAGVETVHIIGGYRIGQLKNIARKINNSYDVDINIIENNKYDETDNLYSFSLASDVVKGSSFFLSNGDVVFDPRIITNLRESSGSRVATDIGTHDEESMKVKTDAQGRLTGISKDLTGEESSGRSIDVYKFTPEASEGIFNIVNNWISKEEQTANWTEAAINAYAQEDHNIKLHDIEGKKWGEIDTEEDLINADMLFSDIPTPKDLDAVFFDLDGTIYLSNHLMKGADEVISQLRSQDVDVYFLTNNSSDSKQSYSSKLTNFGVSTNETDIISSTDGVIDYLLDENSPQVYVLGTESMRDSIQDSGIETTEMNPTHVVVGFDKELTYEKASKATLAIRDGAEFLLAHPDKVCPVDEGFIPDCGSIGAMIETATGQSPSKIFGKPNPAMISHILDREGYRPSRTLVVGDRLNTDIQLGKEIDAVAVCVLSGDTDRIDIETDSTNPDLVLPEVGDLLRFI